MKKSKQMSESLLLGIILALSGGFMDAYSYVCRGEVFANAQTGNMLLFGVHLSERHFMKAFHYACPVLAFALGIALAAAIRQRKKQASIIHWRQITIVFEGIVLVAVSFMSQDFNLLANSLTSFACGIQVQSFRKINGNGIATTMCIGNLRTATQAMCDYFYTKDQEEARKGLFFYGIIACFVTGAIIGNGCVHIFKERAILGSAILLFIGFLMMFIDEEKRDKLNV